MKNQSSVKSFGILFFIVFLLISFLPLINSQSIRIWPLPIALIFLLLGILKSKILIPLNNAWIKLGEILGLIIAPLVMCMIYFIIVTPIGLLMKIIGKDLLGLKFLKTKTYWIDKKEKFSMRKQF
jgi:predicted membrane metal-binding protein